MKTNKPKVQKKGAKKAAKKELEKSITNKFLEVVKHLGHDAERIGKDIEIAGKFIAKKLSKRFKTVKTAVEHKIEHASAALPAISVKVDSGRKDVVKGAKNAKKVVKKAVAKAKPVVQSVKVAAIASEERAAKAIAKPIKKIADEAGTAASATAKKVIGKAVKATPKPIVKAPVKAGASVKKTISAKPSAATAKPSARNQQSKSSVAPAIIKEETENKQN